MGIPHVERKAFPEKVMFKIAFALLCVLLCTLQTSLTIKKNMSSDVLTTRIKEPSFGSIVCPLVLKIYADPPMDIGKVKSAGYDGILDVPLYNYFMGTSKEESTGQAKFNGWKCKNQTVGNCFNSMSYFPHIRDNLSITIASRFKRQTFSK